MLGPRMSAMLKGVRRWRPEFMASRVVTILPPAALGSYNLLGPQCSASHLGPLSRTRPLELGGSPMSPPSAPAPPSKAHSESGARRCPGSLISSIGWREAGDFSVHVQTGLTLLDSACCLAPHPRLWLINSWAIKLLSLALRAGDLLSS